MKVIIAALLSICLVGCASYGTKIDAGYAATIKEGVTTEAEVLENLGKPISLTRNGDGTKSLVYMYIRSQAKAATFIPIVGAFAGGADTETQTLMVTIENGIVKKWSMTEGASEANTGITAI